jgi:methionyl-tRNA synthetase
VPANEFLNLEGDKISTSRNWAVWLNEYLEDLPGKQDVLRYVLTANAPETKDNDFTWKDFQARNNSELVAIYGNFVNRTMVLTQKYYEGKVPARGELTDYDKATMQEFSNVRQEMDNYLDNFRFRDALKEVMNLARIGNKYLAETEPWKLIKTDPERVKTIMNLSIQICANLSAAFEPFLPFSTDKLRKQMNIGQFKWSDLGSIDLVEAGHQMATPKPVKGDTPFENFEKLDIRVGTVLECQKVPKADKLLQFKIDDGMGGRTIVSGIAKYYNPEELVGQQVCFIANLPVRKLKGVDSQGMILSSINADGKLCIVQPQKPTKPGCTVE